MDLVTPGPKPLPPLDETPEKASLIHKASIVLKCVVCFGFVLNLPAHEVFEPVPEHPEVTPAMQATLRTSKKAIAAEEMEAKKKGKGKRRGLKRKSSKRRLLRRMSRGVSSDGPPETGAFADAEPEQDGDLGDERAKPKRKAKAKAKAKGSPKAKAKAKAKGSPKAKAKAKAKAKSSPKAKAKAKAKATAGKKKSKASKDSIKGGKKRSKSAGNGGPDDFEMEKVKQRRVWIGRRWLFEILPQQIYGCPSWASFKGKNVDYMRADEDYQYGLTWLDENGMEDMPEPEEEHEETEDYAWDENDVEADETCKKKTRSKSKGGSKRVSK